MFIMKVYCRAASHEGKRFNVASFLRHDDSDKWQEFGATSRQQSARDQRRRDELPDELTGLRRALASRPTVDKSMTFQSVTSAGQPTEAVPSLGDHAKYRLRCVLCGPDSPDVQATEANLWPILNTLAQANVTSISLAALAARVA